MSVSILLRLIPGSRADGRLAGQAQVVDTGEVATFRDADEMVALLQRASLASSTEGLRGPSAVQSVMRGVEPVPGPPGPAVVPSAAAGRRKGGPREAGPREPGPREAGPREAGPREAGPREAGPREAGAGPEHHPAVSGAADL